MENEYQCQLYKDTTLVGEVDVNTDILTRQEKMQFRVFDFSFLPKGSQFNRVVIIKNGSVILEKSSPIKTFSMLNKQIRYRTSVQEQVGVKFSNGLGFMLNTVGFVINK